MNQTQLPRGTHKVILHAILKQLLTLATGILNQKYWVTRPYLSFPQRWTPGIDEDIAPIILAPHTLFTPAMKEVIVAASGGAWVNRNPWWFSRTGINGSTPGNICNAISIVEPPSPVLIKIVGTYPPCGLNVIQQVADKRKSTSQGLVVQTQKLDAVIDGKFPDYFDSVSILRNAIGHKLSHISSGGLYMRCRMNFTDNPI